MSPEHIGGFLASGCMKLCTFQWARGPGHCKKDGASNPTLDALSTLVFEMRSRISTTMGTCHYPSEIKPKLPREKASVSKRVLCGSPHDFCLSKWPPEDFTDNMAE